MSNEKTPESTAHKSNNTSKVAIAFLALIIFILAGYSIYSITSLNNQIESLQANEANLDGQLAGLQAQLYNIQQQLSSVASQVSTMGPHQVTSFEVTQECVSASTGCSGGTVFNFTILDTGNSTLPSTSDYFLVFTDLRNSYKFGMNATAGPAISPGSSGTIAYKAWPSDLLFNGTTYTKPNFSLGDKVSVAVNFDSYSTNFTVAVVS